MGSSPFQGRNLHKLPDVDDPSVGLGPGLYAKLTDGVDESDGEEAPGTPNSERSSRLFNGICKLQAAVLRKSA
jgi:hypothetical protein